MTRKRSTAAKIRGYLRTINTAQNNIEKESMVTVSLPAYIIKRGTNDDHAVLVTRSNSVEGTVFYFVAATPSGQIIPPPRSLRYTPPVATRSAAIATIPAGWEQVVVPVPVTIAGSVVIFGGVQIGVYGGVSPWTLQFSTDGINWTNGETLTVLRPLNPLTATPDADGAIEYNATVSGVYFFRVQSGGVTSNVIQRTVSIGGTTPDIRLGDFVLNSESTIGTEVPSFNVYSLDANNMLYNVPRPVTAQFAKSFGFLTTSGQSPNPGAFVAFTNWGQAPVFFEGTENNLFKDGNRTYYVRPPGFQNDGTSNMFDFYRLFPQFQLPENKLVVIEPGVGRRDTYGSTFDTSAGFGPLLTDKAAHRAMISRGASHVRDIEDTNPQNTMKFLGDAWLLELNYPSDGTNPLPDHNDRVQTWCNTTTPSQILSTWINVHLSSPSSENYVGNITYYLWNFELPQAWPSVDPTHFNSFVSLLYAYIETTVPGLQIAIWRYAAARLQNFSDVTNLYTQFNYLLTNPGLTSTQAKDYIDSSVIGLNNGIVYKPGFFNTKAVLQVGFYQTYFRSRENPLAFLMPYIINKRLSPQSKVVSIYWPDIEGVPDSDFTLANVTNTVNGNTRTIAVKPRVGFSAMQTLGAWSVAFMDGIDLWEIVRWNPDDREFLYRDPFWNVPGGNALPNTWPYLTLKGIDWMMCGVWAVSQNKDIIDASTPWNFVNNSAFVLFSNAEFQDPLIGWKLSQDGTKALVMITDFTARNPTLRTHTVTIGGNNYQVKTYYRYTSVVRIDL